MPPSISTKWLIVIILTLIALIKGVWTAIGVFVFGIIIIAILGRKEIHRLK